MRKLVIAALFMLLLLSAGTTKASAETKAQPMVSGGFNFSVILKGDGTVWACGGDEVGNLGVNGGYFGKISTPKQVLGLTDVVAIDCADAYTLALKSDGTVWGWGFNVYNGLGIGKPAVCNFASPLVGVKDVKAIAAGNHMSIFVKKDGTVWYTCMKNNKASRLKAFKNMKNIISVSSAHQSAIALSKDGEVWTWNWEYKDNTGYKISTPVKQKLSNIKAVASGEFHNMALEKDGNLWMWGMNNSGEIGDGTHAWCYSPKKLKTLKNVKMISAGGYYSVAELEDGSFYAWGDNECGQFGNNSTKSSTKPVKVKGFKGVITMDAGMYHTIAIKSNGEVIAAGNNYDGVLGVKDKKAHNTPVKLMDLTKKTVNTKDKNEVYPNGDISDWGDVEPIAVGTAPKGKKLIGMKALYAKLGDDYLHLAAAITDGTPDFVDFYLDTDDDHKAEYKVSFEDKKNAIVNVYKINGKSVKKIEEGIGVYGNVIEIFLYSDWLGNPEKVSVKATYNANADGVKGKVNTEINKWTIVPGSKIAVGERSIKMGAITIDGKLDDWEKLNKTVIQDPKEDSNCKADVTTVYVAMDSKYLYVAAYVTGNPSLNTKLDVNKDGKEDYGANASVKDGQVYYFYYNIEKDWSPSDQSENIAYSGKIIEFAVPLSVFENPKEISIHIWADNSDGKDCDDVDGYYEVAKLEK